MVAKLVLDQLEKTGGSLNPLTLPASNATANQYLQDNGSGVLSWSTVATGGVTNIKHTSGTPVTLVQADVEDKSSLVVSCDASSGNIVVNLPALGTTGLSTCIITVVARADSGVGFTLVVKDSGGTEVWTGIAKNDYVKLCESNSAWLILGHKETFVSSRYPAADQTISTVAFEKMTGNGSGWTNSVDYGGMWNTTDVRLVMPFACFADVYYRLKPGGSNSYRADVALKAGAAGSPTTLYDGEFTGSAAEYGSGLKCVATRLKLANADVIEFWSRNLGSNGTGATYADGTRFDVIVTRIY